MEAPLIKALYISEERDGIIEMPEAVEVVAGKGIVGDRYFLDANRKSPDYEISFLDAEHVDGFNARFAPRLEYWTPRRNVLTVGVDLTGLIGKRFRIGSAGFEGLMPCTPCELLRSRTSPEAFRWFRDRGGLRARIVVGGKIAIGDDLFPA